MPASVEKADREGGVKDAKRVEGYSTGKSRPCERASPGDNGQAKEAGSERHRGSVDCPVLNIQPRFQFIERGSPPFPGH